MMPIRAFVSTSAVIVASGSLSMAQKNGCS
jgi:hypothetical protein